MGSQQSSVYNLRDEAKEIILSAKKSRPVIIAGPCSAETEQQTIATAKALRGCIQIFRAGVWKPRTHPGGFEGVGEEALLWLAKAKEIIKKPVAVEVASPLHVRLAANAGVDVFWIGARTTSDPFAVQNIADEMKHCPYIPVLVKNPVAPDLELWIGAIERLQKAGITTIGAVHRGFHLFGEKIYRNAPVWSLPIEFRRRMPDIPLLHDPSHVSGRRDLIASLCQQAMDVGFDGLMVEAHTNPDDAVSDALQQIVPEELINIVRNLRFCKEEQHEPLLDDLRREIDRIDDNLVALLAERMKVCRDIGVLKAKMNMQVVQTERYADLMESKLKMAKAAGVSEKAMRQILESIHGESVRQQLDIINTEKG